MKRFLIFIAGVLFFLSVSGQKCPTINVKGPFSVTAGNDLNLIAEVKGTDDNITYNWSLSNGTISSGQGTSSIKLEVGVFP